MKIVFLKRFTTMMEAELAQNLLKEEGIISTMQTTRLNMFAPGGDVLGSMDLFVAEKDFEKAKEIFDIH